MLLVTIKNLQGNITHGGQFSSLELTNLWIAEQSQKLSWGKPSNFYPLSQLSQEELAQELSRKTVDDLGNSLQEPLIEIPNQFVVEIIDLEQDYNWCLTQCHENRRKAYPSLGDFADAFVKLQEGDSQPMSDYVQACLAVKQQFPKPQQ